MAREPEEVLDELHSRSNHKRHEYRLNSLAQTDNGCCVQNFEISSLPHTVGNIMRHLHNRTLMIQLDKSKSERNVREVQLCLAAPIFHFIDWRPIFTHSKIERWPR